jgi:hypothetical protein
VVGLLLWGISLAHLLVDDYPKTERLNYTGRSTPPRPSTPLGRVVDALSEIYLGTQNNAVPVSRIRQYLLTGRRHYRGRERRTHMQALAATLAALPTFSQSWRCGPF